MKKPYRYFRSELNGMYFRALIATVNNAVINILDEYAYQALYQWKLEGQTDTTELPIREDDIYNVAKIAGLTQLRVFGQTNIGSIYLSKSHIVNGVERSERGFVDMHYEYMKYLRTDKDTYVSDISNEATKSLKAGLVPSDRKPIGYIIESLPIYDEQGNLIKENILPKPPTDNTPYAPFYGEEFLTTEEIFNRDTFLDITTFKALFECLQRIRYNGQSIKDFLEITQILGNGYIYQIEIVPEGRFYTVNYRLNKLIDVQNKTGRKMAWHYVCEQMFKLFRLNELDD